MPFAPSIIDLSAGHLTQSLQAQVDAIFFEASGRTTAPGPEREAFHERWLGRYLHGGTDIVLLAVDHHSTVAGYLVGAVHDPAAQRRFDDLPYFRGQFRELCRQYPAHLHINLAPEFRSQGVGARLIEAFAARARAAGAAGMHVVTGTTLRNVRFYTRCGFTARGTTPWNGGDIVFLGRTLGERA
jgi:GNAT superfamily N-acetyltransferase